MDDEALSRLRVAISRLARQLGRHSADEDLTPTQALTLGTIVARGPLSLAGLARLEGLHPAMLSRVVGVLEGKGLITRDPDPDDLRSIVVTATPTGQEASAHIREGRAAVLADATASLTPEQERVLTAAIPVLETLVRELLPSA